MNEGQAIPEVSVLIAVYNGERYIEEAIDSILAQTFDDFELLVINDGSTDATRDLVLSFDDPRIHLIDNECNCGLSKSLNRGLREARGYVIARQDADDVSEPERLDAQVSFMKAHPDMALVGSWYTKIDARGRKLGERRLPSRYTDIRWALLFYSPFVHSAVMIHAQRLHQVGLYNESLAYALDYELWNRMAARFPVANIEQALVRIRDHGESMTSTYGERALEGDEIRIGTVSRLLDWSAGFKERDAMFKHLHALVTDMPHAMDPETLHAATHELLRLQARFCEVSGLDETECRRHREALSDQMSRRLIREGHAYPDTLRRRDAARLLRMALQLDRHCSYKPSGLELMAKLLLGARGVNWIRRMRLS